MSRLARDKDLRAEGAVLDALAGLGAALGPRPSPQPGAKAVAAGYLTVERPGIGRGRRSVYGLALTAPRPHPQRAAALRP